MALRPAQRADLPAILALLDEASEPVEPGEDHLRAFAAVEADARNELLVVDDGEGAVIACAQVTYIPGLGRGGAERALVEGVRVREDRRGAGVGGALMEALVERARDRGCALVQLTSNKRRADAHRFYASLGFAASHEGFKLAL